MTAPSIISHREAVRIVQSYYKLPPGSAWHLFASTGEITPDVAQWACGVRAAQARGDRSRLVDYLRAHGRRGPVEAGYRVTVRKPVGLHHGKHKAREQAEEIGGEFELGPQGFVVFGFSRRKVDTLNTARGAVIARLTAAGAAESELKGLHSMDAEGGTFSLPDGSSITVEKTEGWDAL